MYPLSQAAHPSLAKRVDVSEVMFDSTLHYDAGFFMYWIAWCKASPGSNVTGP